VKPEPKAEQEKTLEEGIIVIVISSHGEASNLQNMKDVLEACQKLRRDISRAVKMGRTCDSFPLLLPPIHTVATATSSPMPRSSSKPSLLPGIRTNRPILKRMAGRMPESPQQRKPA
jgi:hypothetical protein